MVSAHTVAGDLGSSGDLLAAGPQLGRPRTDAHRIGDALPGVRGSDAFLLLAGLVGVFVWAPDEPLVTALVVAVWTFGVLEFVNYFIVRLAYPPSQWLRKVGQWRTPRLVLDMTYRTPGNRD